MFVRSLRTVGAALVVSAAAVAPSFAAAITLPAEITDAGASVLLVGAAVFGIMVSIKLYKWIKRAL